MTMNNIVAGSLRIANYWYWARKKKWRLAILPAVALVLVALAVGASRAGRTSVEFSGLDWYRSSYAFYALVVVPILSVVSGVNILRDEIEAKTLAYLWTRPCGRLLPTFVKAGVAYCWITASALLGLALLFLGDLTLASSDVPNFGAVMAQAMVLVWDGSAIAAAISAYLAIGFLCSSLFRRALEKSMAYVLLVDFLSAWLPGSLKFLSVKVLLLSLSSSGVAKADRNSFSRLFESFESLPAAQAMATLLVISLLCYLLAGIAIWRREFGRERAPSAS